MSVPVLWLCIYFKMLQKEKTQSHLQKTFKFSKLNLEVPSFLSFLTAQIHHMHHSKSQPATYVFGLWEETGIPRKNPKQLCYQLPHSAAPAVNPLHRCECLSKRCMCPAMHWEPVRGVSPLLIQ